MPASLYQQTLDPLREIEHYQKQHLRPGSYGATTSFVGTMRDFNVGDEVQRMTLEHYPAMTQQFLDKLCDEAMQQWQLVDCLVIHRYGEITPGEPIVLIAVWSAHRKEAFAACQYLIEELKARAPFWKKETVGENERWVHEAPSD